MKTCLSLWLVLGIVSCACGEMHVHVSADAAPGGNGSLAKPYQTLTEARDGIRNARKAGRLASDQAVTVDVAPGVYSLPASLELTAEDSGMAAAPIIYRSGNPGKVSVQGGVVLEPASFTPVTDAETLSRLDATVRDKVRVCDLSGKVSGDFPAFKTAFRGPPAAPWLYVNHQPMTLARWPNADTTDDEWARFSKSP